MVHMVKLQTLYKVKSFVLCVLVLFGDFLIVGWQCIYKFCIIKM